MTRDRNKFGPHIPPATPATATIWHDLLGLVLVLVLWALILFLVYVL